jgi:hypothetical protein
MTQLKSDLTSYGTVATWLSGTVAPPARRAQWLETLRGFCEAEGKDPDQLITEGLQSQEAKNEIMKRLVRWAKTQSDDERQQHDMQTAVRGFFIRNGLRVLTKPYPDVYKRRPGT